MTDPGGSQRTVNDYLEFSKALGRAMAHMALYGAQHPSVGEAALAAHGLISGLMDKYGDELTLSVDQSHVLGNGLIMFGVEKLPSGLAGVMTRFHLDSITFHKDATAEELKSFCELSLVRPDKVRDFKTDDFFREKNVSHIRVNATVYARVSEGQRVVSAGETGGGSGVAGIAGAGGAGSANRETIEQKLSNKSLDESLSIIVAELNLSDEERRNVTGMVLSQINQELEGRVQKATQSLRNEKLLVENKELRTGSVLESSAEGVVVVDANGNILMMNTAAENIFGGKLADLSGKPISGINQENQLLALSDEITTPSDKLVSGTVNLRGKEDDVRVLRHSSAVIKNKSGDIVGSTMVPLEVTKLREYDRMQKEFIANVTHELRSPLTSISAALQMLNADLPDLSKEHKTFLNTAVRNAQRLNSIISDILDFSKLQAGRLTVHPQPCDPAVIVAEAVAAMHPWAKSKNVTLASSGGPGGMYVLADSSRTVQVLVNLISNAIKFTPDGGKIDVSLGLATHNNAECVRFEVKDTGPGIAREDQARIFERFVQIAAGEKVGGTGLGLPITKALAVMQQGSIELESDLGKGSSFKVFLPAAQPPLREEIPVEQPVDAAPETSWWKKFFGK